MSGLVGRKGLGPVGLVFLILGAITTLASILLSCLYSLPTSGRRFSVSRHRYGSVNISFENVGILIQKIPFWINLGWSIYVGFAATALTLLFCSMAGFAFAAYNFRGKNALFALVMATMIIPAFLGMVPSFILMDTLGWIDQPRALYLPAAAPALGIFLMRQYIQSAIPNDLLEAARLDGCGEFSIYWRVVVPLLGPAFGTLGLIAFIGSWNNFIGPLIVMRSVERYTFPLALRSVQSPVDTEWGALMAGSVVAVLPLLLSLFFHLRS